MYVNAIKCLGKGCYDNAEFKPVLLVFLSSSSGNSLFKIESPISVQIKDKRHWVCEYHKKKKKPEEILSKETAALITDFIQALPPAYTQSIQTHNMRLEWERIDD